MMNVDNANRGADKTAAPEARQGPFPHRPKREWLTRGPWDLNHRSGRHEFICTKALVDQLQNPKFMLPDPHMTTEMSIKPWVLFQGKMDFILGSNFRFV